MVLDKYLKKKKILRHGVRTGFVLYKHYLLVFAGNQLIYYLLIFKMQQLSLFVWLVCSWSTEKIQSKTKYTSIDIYFYTAR